MDNNDSRYLLTFDLKILYCPNIKIRVSCKELDLETLEFSKYRGNIDDIDTSYPINVNEIEKIVKYIINGEFRNGIKTDYIEWLEMYEKALSDNPNLINDNKLAFNYLVLKYHLLGFPKNEAIDMVKFYFALKIKNYNIPPIEEVISILNNKINTTKYWIPNTIQEFKYLELDYLRTVFKDRLKYKYDFDFNFVRENYLKVCSLSFIKSIYQFNKEPSYLVRTPLDMKEQKKYIINNYRTIIVGIIQYLLENEFPQLNTDDKFLNSLITELTNTVDTYLSVIKLEERKERK